MESSKLTYTYTYTYTYTFFHSGTVRSNLCIDTYYTYIG